MDKVKNAAKRAVDALIRAGAQRAQCYAEEKTTCELEYAKKAFSMTRVFTEREMVLKCFDAENRSAQGRISLMDDASIDETVAQMAVMLANGYADPESKEDISSTDKVIDFGVNGPELDLDRLFARADEYIDDTFAKKANADMQGTTLMHIERKRVYCNSRGALLSQDSRYYKTGKFNFINDLESRILKDDVFSSIIPEQIKDADVEKLEEPFVGKILVMPNGVRHLFWHSRLVSYSDGSIAWSPDKKPRWKWFDQIGEKVASDGFSLMQRPIHPDVVGAERFYNDGYINQNLVLVENGVCKAFPLSETCARICGREANTGEQAYSDELQFNLVIAPGEKSAEELLAGIERGLLLFAVGGSANGATGCIDSSVRNGFLIEHGKVTKHISCMIHFDFFEAMKHVEVSGETLKNGIDEIPWMTFDGISVK